MTDTWTTTVSEDLWESSTNPGTVFQVTITDADAGGGVSDHGALTGLGDDDHPQYQLVSVKGNANGYPSLDESGVIPDDQISNVIARDTEVAAAVTAHNGSGSAHPDIRALISTDIEVDLAGAIAEDLPGYMITNASDGAVVLVPLDQEGVRVLCGVYLDTGFVPNDANKGKVYVVGAGPGYALSESGEQLQIGGLAVATAETWDPGTDDELLGIAAKIRGAIFLRSAEPYGIEMAAVGEFSRRIATTARNLTVNSDNPTADVDDFTGMVIADPASNGGNVSPVLHKLLYRPGDEIHFLRTTAGTVTITAASGELIDGASTYVMRSRYCRLRNLRTSWTVVETDDIADLYGVNFSSPTTGQVLTYDGSEWVNDDPASGGGTVDVVSNVATSRILGRTTAGTGDSEELTATQVRTLLGVGRHWKKAPPASSYDTGFSGVFGALPWDSAANVAAEAYAAGTMVGGWCEVGGSIATVQFEISATSLTSGQAVILACYALDANGKPTGSPLWTESKVVGTSTGAQTITLSRDLGTEGCSLWLLNPSGNSGSVSIYNYQPAGPYHAATRSVSNRPALQIASMAAAPDLTAYKYNTATGANAMAYNQRMPMLFLKS